MRDLIFSENDRSAAERICLNHVAADFQKPGMNIRDRGGLADEEMFGAAFELRAAVIFHSQILRVQIRAHRAIKDDDAFFQCVEKTGHLFTRKSPALLTTRGLHQNFPKRFERLAELFSRLFYVAASRLNSPRLSTPIETLPTISVNARCSRGVTAFEVFSVSLCVLGVSVVKIARPETPPRHRESIETLEK